MPTLAVELEIPNAENVSISQDTLCVDLCDGRSISVPTAWYPRLLQASQEEREQWKLIAEGSGIHWEAIDEDISVEGLILGKPSQENQVSFKKWLLSRKSS